MPSTLCLGGQRQAPLRTQVFVEQRHDTTSRKPRKDNLAIARWGLKKYSEMFDMHGMIEQIASLTGPSTVMIRQQHSQPRKIAPGDLFHASTCSNQLVNKDDRSRQTQRPGYPSQRS